MDINKLIERVKSLIVSPKTEWPVIAGEPATIADLYKNYVIVLAAIPVIATFVHTSIIGTEIWLAGRVRTGIGAGLTAMVVSYALSLFLLYVLALIIDALAPNFGAQKDRVQAFKTAAYSMTASWVAGAAVILPGVGGLIALLGGLYGIYLMYLALPHTMKSPAEKSAGYTAVIVIVAIVMSLIVGGIAAAVTGMVGGGASIGKSVRFDKDSPLGNVEQWSKGVEEAGKKLEAAQASGDQQAQAAALGEMFGAALSGGGGSIDALPVDRLKAFLPESLDGLPRSDVSAERSGAMGLQVSTARAAYTDPSSGRSIELEIIDTASAKGLLALAGFAGIGGESERNGITEKVYRDDGRLVRELWDRDASAGEYSVVVGERFSAKVQGSADSLSDLKKALNSIDLRGLERLKDEGAQQ